MSVIQRFETDSEAVRFYVGAFLQDGKPRTKAEIVEYVHKQLKREVTPGTMSGVLYKLTNKDGEYIVVERGIYQYIGKEAKKFNVRVGKIIQQTIEELENEAQKINVLDMSDEDLNTIKIVKKIIGELSNHVKNIK